MNEEHFNEWCSTLISGTIKQADSRLVEPVMDDMGRLPEDPELRMCCLGVGMKVMGREIVVKEQGGIDKVYGFQRDAEAPEDVIYTSMPSLFFHHWLGLITEEQMIHQHNEGTYSDNIYIDWPEDLRIIEGGPYEGEPGVGFQPLARMSDSDVASCASLNDSGFTFGQIVDIMRYFGIKYDVDG